MRNFSPETTITVSNLQLEEKIKVIVGIGTKISKWLCRRSCSQIMGSHRYLKRFSVHQVCAEAAKTLLLQEI
jgi:hypothetical protein